MRVHSKVGLVTNSSSETYSFASLGRSQESIDAAVESLWIEYCLAEENQEFLREWWAGGTGDCTGRCPGNRFDNSVNEEPYSTEAAIAWGSPITFSIREDGKAEVWTSMDNETVSDEFARFVEKRMSMSPMVSGIQREVCAECMARGLNVCPPCRL